MPHEPWQGLDHVRFDDELVVIGVEELRDLTRILPFVDSIVWEPNRKGLHSTGRLLRHRGDNSARVDATRQESSERNVTAKPQARRVEQVPSNELTRLLVRLVNLVGVRKLPITLLF